MDREDLIQELESITSEIDSAPDAIKIEIEGIHWKRMREILDALENKDG